MLVIYCCSARDGKWVFLILQRPKWKKLARNYIWAELHLHQILYAPYLISTVAEAEFSASMVGSVQVLGPTCAQPIPSVSSPSCIPALRIKQLAQRSLGLQVFVVIFQFRIQLSILSTSQHIGSRADWVFWHFVVDAARSCTNWWIGTEALVI